MTNIQLYFAIGIPTFSILVGIVVGLIQSNHVLNQLNLRLTSMESTMNSRFALLESALKTLVRATNDLDVRLARLEERLAK